MTFMEIRSLKWLLKSLRSSVFTFVLFFTTFHNFLHFSLDIKLSQVLDFVMNIGFLNELGFRYGNFFIPRVEKIFIADN